MRSTCLMIFRVSVTLWLGAALFFSAVALKPNRAQEIEATVRPQIALILFPGYYACALSLLGIALVAGGIAVWGLPAAAGRRRIQVAIALVVLALGCVLADLQYIYSQLEQMMHAALQSGVLSAEFRPYHIQSMTINGVMVSLTLIASVLACWPSVGETAGGLQLPAQVDPRV